MFMENNRAFVINKYTQNRVNFIRIQVLLCQITIETVDTRNKSLTQHSLTQRST